MLHANNLMSEIPLRKWLSHNCWSKGMNIRQIVNRQTRFEANQCAMSASTPFISIHTLHPHPPSDRECLNAFGLVPSALILILGQNHNTPTYKKIVSMHFTFCLHSDSLKQFLFFCVAEMGDFSMLICKRYIALALQMYQRSCLNGKHMLCVAVALIYIFFHIEQSPTVPAVLIVVLFGLQSVPRF